MKIYLITGVPFPFGMAPTNRIKCYAKAIESQGVECEIVLYLQRQISLSERSGMHDGIRYMFVGQPIRHKDGLMMKLEQLADEIRLLRYLKKVLNEGDIVISYGATVGFTPIVVRTVHKKKAKFVLELVELPYGTSAETLKMKVNRQKILNQFVTYDGVIAISQALADLAMNHIGPLGLVEKVPILVDYEKYCLPDNSNDVEVPFIFHSGSLSQQKDGFVGMIEAFGLLTQSYQKGVRFISTGTLEKCPHKDEVTELIERYHLRDKLLFTGYLDDDQLADYLSKASIVIINKDANQQNTYCFSTKLGEYMAAGKAVIITNVGEATNWLKDGYDARIIEPGTPQQLAQTIRDLMENETVRKQIAENARKSCKKYFDYRGYGTRFIDYFKKLNL